MANHVVDQLGHASGADFSGVENLIAEGVQDGLNAIEYPPLSAHHHCKISAGGS
jgi:hypothetical protein